MNTGLVLRAAAVTLAIVVVPSLAIRAVAGSPAPDTVYSAYLLLFIVGFVAGGAVAGRREPQRPYTHGAAAGGLAAALLFVVGVALAATAGRLSAAGAITIAVSVPVAVSLAMIGSVLGRRMAARAA